MTGEARSGGGRTGGGGRNVGGEPTGGGNDSGLDDGSGGGFHRPRIVMSRCLELDACRYDARMIRSGVVRLVEPYVELVPICPEVEMGLGVPRDPIHLVAGAEPGGADAEPGSPGELRLVQPSTGRDLTDRMTELGHAFADATGEIDGLLLKSRSPSCGVRDVDRYAGGEDAPVTGTGPGMFAGIMRDRYPLAAMEDEARLTDAAVRHHWLTRVFASAALRAALAEGPAALVDFHTRHKLVLMAHSPEGQRRLGRLVADAGTAFDEVAPAYRSGFAEAVSEPAGRGGHVNAIDHARGYVKDALDGDEKRQLEAMTTAYREGELPLQALLDVLAGWAERFDEPYLRTQAYFRPYPRPLVDAGR